MSNLFSRKNIEAQQADTRSGLLEELNMPPEIISFIRKNARIMQIGAICIALAILGWLSYDYYAAQRENKGAALLASAMQVDSQDLRAQILENVLKDYTRTDAAIWSRLELGNIAYQAGRFEEAAGKFKETLDKLHSASPLIPLVRLSLAQSYEEADQYDQAIAQYNLLKKDTGFKRQANLALGRIFVAKGEADQARRVYEELLQGLAEQPDPELKSKVEATLASLGVVQTTSPSSPPEEKKD